MARPRYNRPTDAEVQILTVFWNNPGGRTVRQIFNAMKVIRHSGYNSNLKLVQIMHAKDYLSRDDSVRPQIYHAELDRAYVRRLMMRDVIDRVFDGDHVEAIATIERLRDAKPTRKLARVKA